MTALATAHGAINLAQGFPDFEGPPALLDLAEAALRQGNNQYARSMGLPALVEALAIQAERDLGLQYDPLSEIVVCCGATEAIAASLLGLLDPGDEVILFEPFYDSYPACLAMAGATARYVTLRAPDYALDLDALAASIGPRCRAILLNSPHNPSGKVFDEAELAGIARLCEQHDLIVIADEVYEHIVFDGARHRSIASLAGMRERCLRISSAGKTYSMTGWKIGWAMGPAQLIAAAQAAHQFLTFCAATPLQAAMAGVLDRFGPAYHEELRQDYSARRSRLVEGLRAAGFAVTEPAGTYFALADFSAIWPGDDRSLAEHLVREHGLATIPPSVFYHAHPEAGRKLLRFAFCKRIETLEAAMERLQGFRQSGA
jgi:N-succinyldiaminopimelate aminotransferase